MHHTLLVAGANLASVYRTLFFSNIVLLAGLMVLAFVLLRNQTSQLSDLEEEVDTRTRELAATIEQLERANEALVQANTTDALTGVGNRAAYEEALQSSWEHARRSQSNVSLLIVDIDAMAELNATLSHPSGDEALRVVADVIGDVVTRHNDAIARVGGDEFAIVLPETNLGEARALGESIRLRVERLAVSDVALSVSIGVGTARPTEVASREELTHRADRAVHHAKAKGRNRVVAFDDIFAADPAT